MTYISSNNGRQPVTKNFTTLHYTAPNYTSIHFTKLHYPLIWLNSIQFPTAPLHLTSLHFTALLDYFRHSSIPFMDGYNLHYNASRSHYKMWNDGVIGQ